MISICLIMKNEEASLDKCLSPIKQLGYEIVIADTGSTDRSKEIALSYTDKVFDYKWQNDFADARNFIASKATNDFILFIDCDEHITRYDKEVIKSNILHNLNGIGRLLRINKYTRGNEKYSGRERVSRLYNKKIYRYEGIVHEQIVNIKGQKNIYYDIPIEMNHYGYEGDADTRSRKAQRNIALLTQQLSRNPKDPYVLYQLGKSYYMQQDYIKACGFFEKALGIDIDEKLEYVQDLVETYGYALLESKKYDVALQLLNIYDVFSVTADFVFLTGLIYMNNSYFKKAIEEFMKATNMKNWKMDGVNSYRANYNIGVIYECTNDIDMAKEYYELCGEYEPALERVKELSKQQ